MTASQMIEKSAQDIWMNIGKASSKLVVAIVRRRIGYTTITDVIYALEAALREAKVLQRYMNKIKEQD